MVPFDVESTYGSRGRVSVAGTVNGVPFRSSIFPNGDGTHHMMLNRQLRSQAKANPGDVIRVEMEADTVTRVIEVPDDLTRALKSRSGAWTCFEKLSPSHRRTFVEWVSSAKRDDTRLRRVTRAVDMVLARARPR